MNAAMGRFEAHLSDDNGQAKTGDNAIQCTLWRPDVSAGRTRPTEPRAQVLAT